MTGRSIPKSALEKVEAYYDGADAEFFRRVWREGLDRYTERLRAVGFEGHAHVLDCGFGMAQWTTALADLNAHVSGIDVSSRRVSGARAMMEELAIPNVAIAEGSIERLPYEDATFDAVFCYGVLFLADVEAALAEIHRVLKPSGKLYCTANGLGWFLFLLIEEHNKSESYDPRAVAAHALETSLFHRAGGPVPPAPQFVVPSALMRRYLDERGFRDVRVGPEGSLTVDPARIPTSFYGRREYLGYEMVYEVLCSR